MKKSKWIIMMSLLVFAGAIYLATNLGVQSNMEDMLPEDRESYQATKHFDEYFEGQDQIVLVIENNELSDEVFKDRSIEMMESINDSLIQKSLTANILYKLEYDEITPYLWAFVDYETYEEIDNAIEKKDISTLLDIVKKYEKDSETEYLESDDKRHFIMMITPKIDKNSFVESRDLFYDGINQIIDELPSDMKKGLEIGLTGGAFIQDLESDRIAFQGMDKTLIVTLLAVLIIVILFVGNIRLPLMSMYPLILGATIAAAFAYIIFGSLNMFSVSFALLLVGLGIDFAVHLIIRYQEEREKSIKTDEALKISIGSTGKSIVIGALTTSLAFIAFAFAKFKAFGQMGVISSIGIISLCIAMLFVVPALIHVFDKRTHKSKHLRLKYLNKLMGIVLSHPFKIIGLVLVLAVLLAGNILDTSLENDISSIYPSDLPSLKYAKVVEEAYDYNTNAVSVLVDDYEDLDRITKELEKREDIKGVTSVLSYMPKQQTEKISI